MIYAVPRNGRLYKRNGRLSKTSARYNPVVLEDRMATAEIETRIVSALESIEKLERYIDDAAFVPATQEHRGQMILALFSKALTVGRAICSLVRAEFGEEAFGMF
jgi:hypothetical protein